MFNLIPLFSHLVKTRKNSSIDLSTILQPSWTLHYAVLALKHQPCLLALLNSQSVPSRTLHCTIKVLNPNLWALELHNISLHPSLNYTLCSLSPQASTLNSWTTQQCNHLASFLPKLRSRKTQCLSPQLTSLSPSTTQSPSPTSQNYALRNLKAQGSSLTS